MGRHGGLQWGFKNASEKFRSANVQLKLLKASVGTLMLKIQSLRRLSILPTAHSELCSYCHLKEADQSLL